MADAPERPADETERKRIFPQRYQVLHSAPNFVGGMRTGRTMFVAGIYGTLLSLGLLAVLAVTGRVFDAWWLLLLVAVTFTSQALSIGGAAVFMGASIGAAEAVQYSLRTFGE